MVVVAGPPKKNTQTKPEEEVEKTLSRLREGSRRRTNKDKEQQFGGNGFLAPHCCCALMEVTVGAWRIPHHPSARRPIRACPMGCPPHSYQRGEMGSWAIILGVTRDPSDGGDLARNFWEVREEEKSERDQKIAPVCPSPKKPTKGNGTRRGRGEALKYGHEKRRPIPSLLSPNSTLHAL